MEEISMHAACNLAADQMEKFPHTFNFMVSDVPKNSGHGGESTCILGWVAHFYGEERIKKLSGRPYVFATHALFAMGRDVGEFSQFCDEMCMLLGSGRWISNAKYAALALRKFADLHFTLHVVPPAPAPVICKVPATGFREWLRALKAKIGIKDEVAA